MVQRDILIETAVAVIGTALLAGIIIAAGTLSGSDPSRSDGALVVVGIAVFIVYMAIGGYWLHRRTD